MSKWNGKRFSVYESEEKSALGLIKELGEQSNYNTDEVERLEEKKLNIDGDFKGSWWGLSKPTMADEGLKAQVEKSVIDIDNLNARTEITESNLNQKVNRSDNYWATLNIFDEQTREIILNGGEINAVLGDLNITTSNIDYNSIGADKLAFGKMGKNKFANDFKFNMVLGGDGTNGTYEYRESNGAVSLIVKVESGKTYTIQIDEECDRFIIGESATYPKKGDKVTARFNNNTVKYTTLKCREGMNYFIIYVSSATQSLKPRKVQIEEGTKKTIYTPPTIILPYESGTIPENAIYKQWYKSGYQIGSEFNINLDDQTVSFNYDLPIIVCGDERYKPQNGVYSYKDVDANSICILYNTKEDIIEFSKTSELILKNEFYLFLGTIIKDKGQVYVNGIFTLNNKSVLPYTGNESGVKFLFPNVNGKYKTYTQYLEHTLVKGNVFKLYEYFDKLVTDFPDYVSREQLGNDSSNLPIYKYNFIPPKPQTNPKGIRHLKMLHVSTHGAEVHIKCDMIRFYQDICYNWKNDEVLQMLRWNVQFSVVPVINCYGFNTGNRKNYNGVDINRNFPSGWENLTSEQYTNPTSNYYKGREPFSEVETQIYRDLFNGEYDLIVDSHNYDTLEESGNVMWFGSSFVNLHKNLFTIANTINSNIKKNYNVGTENNNLIMLKGVSDGTTIKYLENLNKKCFITESVWKVTDDKELTQNITLEGLGNVIINTILNINNI